MALSTTVTFTDPSTFPPLLQLSEGVKRPEIRKVMGRGVATAIKNNFRKLDGERENSLGGKRTHFYGRAVKAVQQPELVGGDGVKVTTNFVGIAQRFFGGDIEPTKSKWLTLPARAEAYGHRAREFTDLHFVFFRTDLAALVQNTQTSLGGRVQGSVTEKGRTTGRTTGGGIFYWLVKHVHQEPDPTVLPTEKESTDAALSAGEAHMKTILDRANS